MLLREEGKCVPTEHKVYRVAGYVWARGPVGHMEFYKLQMWWQEQFLDLGLGVWYNVNEIVQPPGQETLAEFSIAGSYLQAVAKMCGLPGLAKIIDLYHIVFAFSLITAK